MTHKWWQNAVVYQIYPQSFQDSNHDGIGDLPGIVSRLPYLQKLGVDVLWLNPIYDSPLKDNGYDIADYEKILPTYGSMADFDKMLQEIHTHHMKLLMDLVVNHTSAQHRWFQESKQSKDNKYANYYIWRDPVDGHAPNNWNAAFGGPAWTYVPERGQYYLHLFAPGQPDLNWENPQVRESVWNIMRFWLDKGVDGFRMDVINLISKPAGLPDAPEPVTYGLVENFVADGPKLNDYLHEMNDKVLSHYNVMTVGEMPGSTPEDAIAYTGLNSHELNMVFQFEHVQLAGNSDPRLGKWNDTPVKLPELKQALSRWQKALDGKGWNSLYWNNHDQPRAVSRFATDDPKYRVRTAKMLGTTLHMMQGTPFVYEGEELGMTNVHYTSLDQYEDLEVFNSWHELVDQEKLVDPQTMLKYLNSRSRDHARTPMQWDNSQNAGFTDAKPWFALNPNYQDINAKKAIADKQSVFYHYQRLIQLRHESDLIKFGTYDEIDPDDAQVFAYRRHYQGKMLLVISNFTDQTVRRDYNQAKSSELLISNYNDDQDTELRPYESKVYLFE